MKADYVSVTNQRSWGGNSHAAHQ